MLIVDQVNRFADSLRLNYSLPIIDPRSNLFGRGKYGKNKTDYSAPYSKNAPHSLAHQATFLSKSYLQVASFVTPSRSAFVHAPTFIRTPPVHAKRHTPHEIGAIVGKTAPIE